MTADDRRPNDRPETNQKGYDGRLGSERIHSQMPETYVDLFRNAPVESTLLSIGPIALALGQLANSYVNGVSPAASLAFAVAMVAFAVVATGHQAAALRLRRLEGEAFGSRRE